MRSRLVVVLTLITLASCAEKRRRRPSEDVEDPPRARSSAAPVPPEPISFVQARARPGASDGVVAISLGDMHACALHADGRVLCWGNNMIGQAHPRAPGSEIARERLRPVEVVTGATDLALSGAYSCALQSGGKLRCWSTVEVAFGEGLTRVSARFGATCGFFSDRGPGCVGTNESGRLLRPGGDDEGPLPGPPFGQLDPLPGLADTMQLAIGGRHGCALSRHGKVSCWGLSNYGQTGDTEAHPTPHEVAGLERVVQLQAGYFGNCARDDRGAVYCWGRNNGGELTVDPASTVGPGLELSYRPTPERLDLPASAEIAIGSGGACSRGRDGGVTCWGGRDSKEELKEVGKSFWSPDQPNYARVPISGVDNPVALAVSTGTSRVFACALTAGGRVLCWGDNSEGQLGDGGVASGRTPIEVIFP